MPFIWEALATGELELRVCGTRVGLVRCEKWADDRQNGRCGVSVLEVGEQTEEETCRTVKEDGLGTEVEGRVGGFGVVIAHAHEFDHIGKIKITLYGFVHHGEQGGIEREVIWRVEVVVTAGQGGVGFEFLVEIVSLTRNSRASH